MNPIIQRDLTNSLAQAQKLIRKIRRSPQEIDHSVEDLVDVLQKHNYVLRMLLAEPAVEGQLMEQLRRREMSWGGE